MATGFENGFVILNDAEYTTSAGDNIDVPIDGSLLIILTSNNNDAICSLLGGVDGALVFIKNASAVNLIIKNNSTVTDGYPIFTFDGSDITVPAQQCMCLGLAVDNGGWYQEKFV